MALISINSLYWGPSRNKSLLFSSLVNLLIFAQHLINNPYGGATLAGGFLCGNASRPEVSNLLGTAWLLASWNQTMELLVVASGIAMSEPLAKELILLPFSCQSCDSLSLSVMASSQWVNALVTSSDQKPKTKS